jgi:hypothetical protein
MGRWASRVCGLVVLWGLVACGGVSPTLVPPTLVGGPPTAGATTAPPTARAAGPAASGGASAAPGAAAGPLGSPAATPATPAPTPATPGTPATPATPRPATPATPGTPGTPGTPRAAAPGVGREATGACQVGLPAGFTAVAGQDGAWGDGTALLVLTPVPMNGLDFATFTQTLAALLLASQPTRAPQITTVQQGPDRYRADFTVAADPTNALVPYAAAGTFAVVPAVGGQACGAELLYPQGREGTYAPLAEGLVASLRPRQP